MQIRKRIEQHPDIAKYNGAIADSVYPELEGKSGERRSMGLHWSKPSHPISFNASLLLHRYTGISYVCIVYVYTVYVCTSIWYIYMSILFAHNRLLCMYIYIHTHVSYACYNMCIEIYVSYTCTHMFVYRSGTFQLALHRSESSGKFMWTQWSWDTDGFRNISVWCHDLLHTWNEQIQEVQIRKSSTAFKKACPGLVSLSPCHNCHKAGHPFSSPSCHNHLKMLRFRKRCFWYLSSWFWGRQLQRLW
jgi:hypothetical protein